MFFSDHVHTKSLLLMALIAGAALGQSQSFSSGSTGADGPLSFTTPSSTPIYFNPSTIPNHHAGDTIFNFTTITIASGVTVRLDSRFLPGPVYWLATGAVEIDGTLDLSGAAGSSEINNQSERIPSAAGAGGFGGGLGGGGTVSAEPGSGPGGGQAGTSSSVSGGGGQFMASQYLIPLVGGSGGGGGYGGCLAFSGSGGAGGGAILIASSASITVNGVLTADGGQGGGGCGVASGGGSGGSIRLMANTIMAAVTANIRAVPGPGSGGPLTAQYGLVRLEDFGLTLNPGNLAGTPYLTSVPHQIVLPATPPASIMVTSVAGIPINANPFSFPDATINSSSPVTINVEAQYIPVGTIPKIIVFSETGPDQAISCSALTGTLQQSTCSASVTLPSGGSRGFVKATW